MFADGAKQDHRTCKSQVIRGGWGVVGSPWRVDHVESDRLFYQRRVTAERLAAARAITVEARDRRMVLVHSYLEKLQALSADLTVA